MSYVSVIMSQTIIMFILMMIGFICYRIGLIDSRGSKQLSNLVIYIANPALLINSFSIKISRHLLVNAEYAIILILGTYIISIIAAKIALKKHDSLNQFAVIFANVGFVGLPLAKAVLGNESVLYMSLFVGISNVVIWTYGLRLAAGDKQKTSLLKLFLNPCILALFVGVLLVLTGIKLPSTLNTVIGDLSATNLPLVMIVLGCYLAEGDVIGALKQRLLYYTCFWRLLVVPIVIALLLTWLPQSLQMARMTILLGSATPVAALMAIFSKQYDGNYGYSAAMVGLSTLFSLVTIPLVMGLAGILWTT